jgi:hypothetical protein
LHGVDFTIITDHQPLKWLMTTKDLDGKYARWQMMLQEYSFDVVHRPGVTHQNADVFSRHPIPSSEDLSGARLDSMAAGLGGGVASDKIDQPLQPITPVDELADVAALADRFDSTGGPAEVWDDLVMLQYLRSGEMQPGLDSVDRKRAKRRARGFRLVEDKLYRVMPDGSSKLVPNPSERTALIQATHEQCGHFGVRRTTALLLTAHWWKGLAAGVQELVSRCVVCDRIKATFNHVSASLQPLSIGGMFYRWGCDLAGPFPTTARGNQFVMIMVEYFSKHIEVVPLPDKRASTTAAAFASHVLGRFGASAEVVTDGGTEFKGEFDDQLRRCMIDHRVTSANHPQADGLAERAVQTMKRALTKLCETSGSVRDWDIALPWVCLGYRCSPQASTKLSPYQLLYARTPVVPPAVAQRVSTPLNFDDPVLAAESLLQRSQELQRLSPVAMGNLQIAQHRDTQRYAMIHSGAWHPKLRKFSIGDFVYVKQSSSPNLMSAAKPHILRVYSDQGNGRFQLIGRCGTKTSEHARNMAPCHLPHIDTAIDPRMARPSVDASCSVCGMPHDEAVMLLCDGCGSPYHTYCLDPPLDAVPPPNELWFCDGCVKAGEADKVRGPVPKRSTPSQPLVPAKPTRDRDAQAALLDGREVVLPATRRRPDPVKGKVKFMGADRRPYYFMLIFDDGTVMENLSMVKLRNSRMLL